MNITEFAASRNKTVGAISNYIRRHGQQFKDLTRKEGNTIVLDDKAIEILNGVYPVPKPVEIIKGIPEEEYRRKCEELDKAQKDLIQAKDMIIALQSQIADKELKLKDLEIVKARLEDKQIQLDQVENEIERLKNRGLIDRILNR